MSTTRLFLIFFALMMALSIFIGIIAGLTYLNQQDLIKSQETKNLAWKSVNRLNANQNKEITNDSLPI
jgi:hypothetical protein